LRQIAGFSADLTIDPICTLTVVYERKTVPAAYDSSVEALSQRSEIELVHFLTEHASKHQSIQFAEISTREAEVALAIQVCRGVAFCVSYAFDPSSARHIG
jgi:hypothetical protein